MKIVYCVGSLVNKGGMEKVLANKVNYLVNKLGYDIHIITQDQKGRHYCYDFDSKIKFHDVNISKLNKRVIKGITFVANIFKLRKIYTDLFNQINPDIIIVSERGYLDFVVPFVKPEIPKIREFHFSKEAVKVHASLMKKMAGLKHLFVYQFIFKAFNKYDYLALLTNRDQTNGNYKTNTIVIPNMMASELPEKSANLESKSVISIGSMHDNRKNFDVQIKLWKEIVQEYPDWKLHIYGDGTQRPELENLKNKLGLQNSVYLHGSSNTMEKHYLDSSIFLFTSKAEGLPMVLIEAQSYGLPIVSYDCPTGPSDIIDDDINGYLIPQDDVKLLKNRLIKLMQEEKLRKEMGKTAKLNAQKFTPENVMKQWIELFNKLKNDKKN